MKQNINDRYECLIYKMKNMNPVLEDPEGLTQAILGEAERHPIKHKMNNGMTFIIWFSSVAAIFLLCLLVKESFWVTENTANGAIAVNSVMIPELQDGREDVDVVRNMEYSEKTEMFFSAVKLWRGKRLKKEEHINNMKRKNILFTCDN